MCKEYQKPEEFVGTGIWHVTSKSCFKSMLADGEIKAEPRIPDDKRYNTDKGTKYYPFVRSIGGISLFDFCTEEFKFHHYINAVNFSPKSCNEELSDIVWIEMDRDAIKDRIITNNELMKQRIKECFHQIIPIYEIAVIETISTSAFIRTIEKKNNKYIEKMIKDLMSK
jgi:hypothetical protein